MKNLSFYEQAGVVLPGALFLFGAMFYIPELKDVFAKDGVSIGGLGIFVIISYACGQLLAAVGNMVEKVLWSPQGGMPSNWIVGSNPRLLSAEQISKVHSLVQSRLGLACPVPANLKAKTWIPIFRQIYSDVEKHGKPARGEMFNGMYGLNRGLCAAALALIVVALVQSPPQWKVAIGLVAVSTAYLYRAHRFGVHCAREVYNQFLLLPAHNANSNPKNPASLTEPASKLSPG